MARKRRGIKIRPRFVLVVALLIAVSAYFGVELSKVRALENERREVEQRREQLIKEKEDLELELELTKLPEYMERLARRDLKLIKGNELLLVIPEKKDK